VTVLDARRSGYPAAFFADATHLNRHGALALSRSVGAAVAAGERKPRTTASSPGWIALGPPADSAGGSGDGLEDVEESRRIVNSDLATRVSSR
jgi:hypothetical protein